MVQETNSRLDIIAIEVASWTTYFVVQRVRSCTVRACGVPRANKVIGSFNYKGTP